jgi:Raf kinase inhibitor-like YbhB/YbcL family protein
VAAALAWLLPISLLGGCGLLSKPAPVTAGAQLGMTVGSQVFAQGVMPAKFTCRGHGGGVSPAIYWSGMPPGTKSLALVVDDSNTPIAPFVYWVVYDINPSTTDLQPGALPPPARQAQNSAHKAGYDPPCPQAGSHKYRFTIYALNTFFGKSLPSGSQLLQAWSLIAKHVIARGTMTARASP